MNNSEEDIQPIKISIATVRMSVIAFVFAATLFFAASVLHLSRDTPPSIYEPTGYIHRVENLVETGVLQYFADSEDSGQPWGKITFSAQETKLHQQAFYQESMRLRRDIATFNEMGGSATSVPGTVRMERIIFIWWRRGSGPCG